MTDTTHHSLSIKFVNYIVEAMIWIEAELELPGTRARRMIF